MKKPTTKKQSKPEQKQDSKRVLEFKLSTPEIITLQKALASRFLSIQSDYFDRIRELEKNSPFVEMMQDEIKDLEHLYQLFTFTKE